MKDTLNGRDLLMKMKLVKNFFSSSLRQPFIRIDYELWGLKNSYSFSQPTLTVVLAKTCCFTSLVMQSKEKPTDTVASSLNFESFPGKLYFCIQDTNGERTFIRKITSFSKRVTGLINKRRFLQRHFENYKGLSISFLYFNVKASSSIFFKKDHINFSTKFKKNLHMTLSFQSTSRYNPSENNLIKIFDIIDLLFKEKDYKSFPLEEYALERGHIQCPNRWKTSDFHLLHVFNPSKKTLDVFNLAEWKGMLSLSWLLSMKRLVTLKYKQRKTSKASS